MTASLHLVDALKRELRARGLTYAEVAAGIAMSEASIKRMLSRRDLSLKKLDAICSFAQIELAELTRGLSASEKLIARLTVAQEEAVVSDPKLFLVAVCALNLLDFDEILASYALAKAELIGFLSRLDRMGFLRLHPNNRYRLLVARTFAWIPDGPIQRTFKEHAADFFDSAFDGPSELMLLLNGPAQRGCEAACPSATSAQPVARGTAVAVEGDAGVADGRTEEMTRAVSACAR